MAGDAIDLRVVETVGRQPLEHSRALENEVGLIGRQASQPYQRAASARQPSLRSQIDRTYLGINHVGGRCANDLTFVNRINPGDVFGALDRRDVEINHNCLVVRAHKHAFQDLVG